MSRLGQSMLQQQYPRQVQDSLGDPVVIDQSTVTQRSGAASDSKYPPTASRDRERSLHARSTHECDLHRIQNTRVALDAESQGVQKPSRAVAGWIPTKHRCGFTASDSRVSMEAYCFKFRYCC